MAGGVGMDTMRERVLSRLAIFAEGKPADETADAIMAIVAGDREKLVAALFDALTCVDCHNCAKHYEQMRAARDAALASVGK